MWFLVIGKIFAYIACGFVVWYVHYSFEMCLNGGSLGRGKWWVFNCFWEELQWFLPGGLEKRTQYIRRTTQYHPHISGYIGQYGYEEIRERNLYEQVARESLGNCWYFWGVDVVLMGLLWPFGLGCIAVLILFSMLFDFFADGVKYLKRHFQKA